jgi:hypothetical protein
MMTPERAYVEMQEANPARVVEVLDRPSAEEALAAARSARAGRGARSGGQGLGGLSSGLGIHGAWVAAVVFAIVLVAGLVTAVLLSGTGDVVDDPVVPTTVLQVPTTEASTTTSTTIATEILDLVDAFAVAYNSGDHEALRALLAPDTTFMFDRQSDPPAPWSDEDLRVRHRIATELSTQISLQDCVRLSGIRISCRVVRNDDLVRIADIEPPSDTFWRFAFEDGLAVQWEELRPDTPEYSEARVPFIRWLTEEHPEVENPGVFIGAPWRTDTGFEDQVADLVGEYAASVDVSLDG